MSTGVEVPASADHVILQLPYMDEVVFDGETIELPFTNTFCEIVLSKQEGHWGWTDRKALTVRPEERWRPNGNYANGQLDGENGTLFT